jgi:putative DNA methylase
MVIDAMKHATEALEFELVAYVIMPEHVHMVVRPNGEWTVSQLMARFKKRTARLVNQHLARSGPFWRDDFFDHVIRDNEHLDELVRYIHDNPVRRGLASKADEWEFSSWQEFCGE